MPSLRRTASTRASALGLSPVATGVFRLVAYRGLVAHERIQTGRPIAWHDVAREGQAFSHLSGAGRQADQFVGFVPADRNQGILVCPWRSRPCCDGNSPAGIRASAPCSTKFGDIPLGAVRSRTAAGLDKRQLSFSATPRIRCFPISDKAPTRQSRMAWRFEILARAGGERAGGAPCLRKAAPRTRCRGPRGARENGLRTIQSMLIWHARRRDCGARGVPQTPLRL